jgi:large subunit ribosomal protein L32e
MSQDRASGALKLRKRLKRKKPPFIRQESWRYKRVSQVWRKPDGIDSKMRSKLKGWPKLVEIGYRGPRKARNLHPSGYEEVLVRNADDLASLDPKTQAARIAHSVGMKKRAEISLRAGERHIYIVNPLPKEKPVEEEAEKGKEEGEEAEEATEASEQEVASESDAKTESEAKEEES